MKTIELRFERYLPACLETSIRDDLKREFLNFKERCLDSGLQFPPEAALYVCFDSDSMAVMGVLHFIYLDGFIDVDCILLDPVVEKFREAGFCSRIVSGLLQVLSQKRVTVQKPAGSVPILVKGIHQQEFVQSWIIREAEASVGNLSESGKSGYLKYVGRQPLSQKFLNSRFNLQNQSSFGEDFLTGRRGWQDPDFGKCESN